MSEIDHTNSLDPDQAQQNVGRTRRRKCVRFKKCLRPKKTRYSARKELGQKRCYIWNTCWVYDVTYDSNSICPLYFLLKEALWETVSEGRVV